MHVACHELLGHGVGKLIYRDAEGKASKFYDPYTETDFESCYEEGDTWNGKFGSISTSFEECRADTCGYFLCQLPEVYTLFGFEENEIDTMLWVNVMNQFRKGILGLQLYNPETQKWGQAHTNGAYVLSMYLYQNQKSDIVKFELKEETEEFYIHLNKENLMKEGKELIKKFLIILQTYKSSGAVELATKFYAHFSHVDEFFLKVRKLVVKNKKPRRIELNNNLMRYNESVIEPVVYPESFEGIIKSYADRFPCTPEVTKQMIGEWNHSKHFLRV